MVLFLHNTSYVEDEPYPTLLRDKGFTGFPSLAFMDADGKVIAQQGERTVSGFNETLTRVESYLELKAKVEGGDESVAAELLIAGLELGTLELADAKSRSEHLEDVTAEQRKLIDAEILNLEVMDLDERMRTGQLDQAEAARSLAEMAKAGRIPTSQAAISSFWQGVLFHADTTEDAELFEQSLGVLKEMFGHIERNAPIFERWERRLKELKGG